jgi:L-seryl-tRNA(Ser) seleniumtransferase
LITLQPPDGVSAVACERRLREGPIPVVARLEKERVILDLRTVLPGQEDDLVKAVAHAWNL